MEEVWPDKLVSLEAAVDPFAQVALTLAADAGLSVVLPSGDLGMVSVSLTGVPVRDAFRELSRAAGVISILRDGIVRVCRPDDVISVPAVLPTGFNEVGEFMEALQSTLGANAQVKRVGDRVVIFCSAQSADNVSELIRQLSHGPDGWALDVRVVQVTQSLREQLGLDWRISGRMGATLGGAANAVEGAAVPRTAVSGVASVEALFQAVATGTDATLVTQSTAYLLEGREVTLTQGDVVPVPQRTVSPEGTVSVSGFSYINTGFALNAKARRVQDGLLLTLKPSVSNVTGFVEGAPIVSRREVESVVVVNSGEWVLLSGLDQVEWSKSMSGVPRVPGLGGNQDIRSDTRTVLMLVRAVRVFASGGPIATPQALEARCALPVGESIRPPAIECAIVAPERRVP